jgi:branched-subunit amino acid aminotransferase/4-amino-4-deoxychorismate lyase
VLRQVVTDLLAAWGERDGALRLIVTRGGTIRGILGAVSWPETISLAVVETPWRTAISGVKTLSYAANQWAVRAAKGRGADDALIVDGGVVHELPTGSICLVHDGVVSSPDPARLPILDSVTVRSLGEVVEVVRTVPSLDDVRRADEVFVLSATRPILPVHAVLLTDGSEVEYPAPGVVTADLEARFQAHIDAHLDAGT